MRGSKAVLWAIATILLMGLHSAVAAADGNVWVLIDTAAERARVFRGQEAIARFRDISIGRGGTAHVRTEGDDTTPLGTFHVRRISYDSRFHIFMELDYPTIHNAERALKAGAIDLHDYRTFLDEVLAYGHTPQDTVLGGHIGIHGLGKADPVLHRRLNWTEGCIALTDDQIDRLAKWVDVGTRVVIR